MSVKKKGKTGSQGSKKQADVKASDSSKLTPNESKSMPLTKVDQEDSDSQPSSASSKSGNQSPGAKTMANEGGKKEKRPEKQSSRLTEVIQYLKEVQLEFRKISLPRSAK